MPRPAPVNSVSLQPVFARVRANTAIDLYPDQVNVWQICPGGPNSTDDRWACFREPNPGPVTRLVQRINQRFNTEVLDEDVDLVSAVQTGIRTRGYRPGPLSAATVLTSQRNH